MFFGEKKAAGIIIGKSLSGYQTDGDSFDRPERPMVRIWLDHVPEDGQPGDDKLTLEVSEDLYSRLEVARHGTAVWRGKRLLRFEMEEDRQDEVPEQDSSRREDTGAAEAGEEASPESQAEEEAAPVPMDCPWCGKPMTQWHMAGRGTLTLESEEPGFFSSSLDAEFIPLSGGFMESGHLLVWVCRDCEKAVIDYKDGNCDYNQQIRKSYLFPL